MRGCTIYIVMGRQHSVANNRLRGISLARPVTSIKRGLPLEIYTIGFRSGSQGLTNSLCHNVESLELI